MKFRFHNKAPPHRPLLPGYLWFSKAVADGAPVTCFFLSGKSETVASAILGSAGEQPAFGFQINAPGVDTIWRTAYVCLSKFT